MREVNSQLTSKTTTFVLNIEIILLTNFKDIKEDENESEEIGIEALESTTQDQEASKALSAKVDYKNEDNFEGGEEDETSV